MTNDPLTQCEILLRLKYGTLKRAIKVWQSQEVEAIEVEGFSSEEVLNYIYNKSEYKIGMHDAEIIYVKKKGFTDNETKVLINYIDSRNEKQK